MWSALEFQTEGGVDPALGSTSPSQVHPFQDSPLAPREGFPFPPARWELLFIISFFCPLHGLFVADASIPLPPSAHLCPDIRDGEEM